MTKSFLRSRGCERRPEAWRKASRKERRAVPSRNAPVPGYSKLVYKEEPSTANSTTGSSSAATFFLPFFLLRFFLTTPLMGSTRVSNWTSMASGSRFSGAEASVRRGRGRGAWYLHLDVSKRIGAPKKDVRELGMLLQQRKSGNREDHQHVRRVLLPRSTSRHQLQPPRPREATTHLFLPPSPLSIHSSAILSIRCSSPSSSSPASSSPSSASAPSREY